MNIRQFECLRAIMQTGNMTQAAELIGISQPSASALISNLEYTLGFKLFQRVKGRLVATAEAKHFLPDVTRALDSIDLALHRAKQIRDNKSGDLTIASYPDIAVDFLPKVLAKLLRSDVSIKVRLLARRSEMMSGLLSTREYDIAIVTRVAETPDLEIEEIRLPCVFAVPAGQSEALPDTLGPGDLSDLRFVTLMPDHPSVVQLAERFAQAGTPYPGAMVETQTFESAAGFIRRGVGCGLLDPITATRYLDEGIVLRRFEPAVFQSIFLLTPADRPKSLILTAFRKILSSELERLRAKHTP